MKINDLSPKEYDKKLQEATVSSEALNKFQQMYRMRLSDPNFNDEMIMNREPLSPIPELDVEI